MSITTLQSTGESTVLVSLTLRITKPNNNYVLQIYNRCTKDYTQFNFSILPVKGVIVINSAGMELGNLEQVGQMDQHM